MPYNCQNDPQFTSKILFKDYKKYFPSETKKFECNTIKIENNATTVKDALMYIPDKRVFYLYVTLLIFGIVIGIGVIIHGFHFEKTTKLNPSLYSKFIEDINFLYYDSNDPKFNVVSSKFKKSLSSIIFKENEDEKISMTPEITEISHYSNRRKSLKFIDADDLLAQKGYRVGRIGAFQRSFKLNKSNSSNNSLDDILLAKPQASTNPSCKTSNSIKSNQMTIEEEYGITTAISEETLQNSVKKS